MTRYLLIVSVLTFGLAVSAWAEERRTVAIMVGALAPSGSSAAYTDGGLLLAGRLNQTVRSFPALSFWAEADIQVLNQVSSSSEKNQSNAYAGFIGAQLGSSSDRAFVRPRLAAGVGVFGVETRSTSGLSDTSTANQSEDLKFRPGLRACTGVDFFFSSSWGLGVEFFWEDIIALRTADPKNNLSSSVQFQGASFCVVLPLGRK